MMSDVRGNFSHTRGPLTQACLAFEASVEAVLGHTYRKAAGVMECSCKAAAARQLRSSSHEGQAGVGAAKAVRRSRHGHCCSVLHLRVCFGLACGHVRLHEETALDMP